MVIQKHLCMFFFLFALFSDSQAYKFYVGGRNGWVSNPSEDYNHWAERNRFQIGDTLIFKYQKGSDSVLEVNKDDYDKCNTKNPIKKFEDGETEFKFDRSGPFYFIGGKDGNCEKGQKLIVVVIAPRGKPSPSVPTPPKAPSPGGQPPVAQPPGGKVPVSPSGSPVNPPTTPAPAGNPPSPSVSPSPVYQPPAAQPPSGGGPVSPLPQTPAGVPGKSPITPSPVGGIPAASPGPGNAPSYPSPRNSPAPAPSSTSPVATSPAPTPTALSPSPSAASPTASPPSPSASIPSPSSTTPGAETPTSSPGATSPASSNETAPSPPGGGGSSAWSVAPPSLFVYSVTIVLSVGLSTVLGAH